jgi:hypothetical protein
MAGAALMLVGFAGEVAGLMMFFASDFSAGDTTVSLGLTALAFAVFETGRRRVYGRHIDPDD